MALAAGAENNGRGLITVAFDNQTLTTYSVRSTHDEYRSMSLRKRWHVDLVNLTRGDALSEDARQCRYNVRIRTVNEDEVPLSSLYTSTDSPTKKVFDKPASLEDDDEEDGEEGFQGMVLVSLTRPSADETAHLRSSNPTGVNSTSSQPDTNAEKEFEEPVYCSSAEPLRVYALDARTGGLLWQYLGRTSSLEEEETALATALPQHPLSLDMREQLLTAQFYAPHYHPYTAHWTLYRQSLLQQLPFHWFDSQDEALYTTHFQGRTRFGDVRVKSSADATKAASKTAVGIKSAPKDKKIRGKKKSDSRGAVRPPSGNGEESSKSNTNKKKAKQNSLLQLKVSNLLSSATSKGKSQSSDSPHAPLKSPSSATAAAVGSNNNSRRMSASSSSKASEASASHPHTRSNVLVLKHAGGVTVLALKTGHLLAQLPLESQRVYADLDHDGNLDSLHFASSASASLDRSHAASSVATDDADACSVLCLQGVPPTAQRFNSTALCGEGFQNRFVHGHSTQVHMLTFTIDTHTYNRAQTSFVRGFSLPLSCLVVLFMKVRMCASNQPCVSVCILLSL